MHSSDNYHGVVGVESTIQLANRCEPVRCIELEMRDSYDIAIEIIIVNYLHRRHYLNPPHAPLIHPHTPSYALTPPHTPLTPSHTPLALTAGNISAPFRRGIRTSGDS